MGNNISVNHNIPPHGQSLVANIIPKVLKSPYYPSHTPVGQTLTWTITPECPRSYITLQVIRNKAQIYFDSVYMLITISS